MWYAIVWLGMLLAFLFPWFLLCAIQNMIKGEKYGLQTALSCISFGTAILSVIIMLS